MNRVTADKTKYNAIVAFIDGTILQQVSDLVLNPPLVDRYKSLKDRILERFADSDESRLRKLLTGISLGDKKNFASSSRYEGTCKLPNQCQAILPISSEDLDKLAAMADKICDISLSAVCGISTERTRNTRNVKQSEDDLAAKLNTVVNRLDNME